MIGLVTGKIEAVDRNRVLVNTVSGVGYWIYLSPSILVNSGVDQQVSFYIHTHVREDDLSLFGFSNLDDLRTFEKLIGVNGIGPKLALNLFKAGNGQQIRQAILAADTSFFTSVPGIGQRNAQKIIIELQNKIQGEPINLELGISRSEVVSALEKFGFSSSEIRQVVSKIDPKDSAENQLKTALKALSL